MGDRDSRRPGTVCPLCSVGCHLSPDETGSRARGVAGPANPRGRLCRKGITAFDIVADENRLDRPLVRRDRGLRPAGWDAAYGEVVDRFERILRTDGPDALAFFGAPYCTTEANYLLQKLARTLGTNNVDNRARHCHAASTRALSDRVGWPATTNGLSDLEEADVVLLAGANPARRQPVAFNSFVRPAVTEGTTLVHVDPVGNETTRLADHHLAPRPGTDALAFSLLCALVRDAGGVDREFIAERTRGYDAVASRLDTLDVQSGRELVDVDADALAAVAALIADAERVAAMVGTGIDEEADGAASPPDTLLDLLLLTGNLGRRGTGLYVLRGLVNEQGATDAGCVPDRLPGHQSVTDPEARARVGDEWGVEPPTAPGLTATDMLASFGDGVRGALVVGENPAVSKRDDEWIRQRLDALDALVALDVTQSATTDRADVVLPAAAGVEKSGTVTNLERRVQRLHPTTDPPGEARPDWRILGELGRRLVDESTFDCSSPRAVFEEFTRVAPTHAGVSYADVDGRQWPFDRESTLYRERFETPDGLAAFSTGRPVVDVPSEWGLHLVTGGRTSEFYGDRDTPDDRLRIHPADADDRGLEDGERVVVSNDDAAVDVTATRDDSVRRGTVYLPASVADPLCRSETPAVVVEPADSN